MNEVAIPSVKDLYNPVLQALHRLGGEGSNQEIEDAVIELMNLSPEQIEICYESPGHSKTSKCIDRIGWARSHLKIAGLIDQPRRRVWHLTEKGRSTPAVSPSEVKQALNSRKKEKGSHQPVNRPKNHTQKAGKQTVRIEDLLENYTSWREQLFDQLHQFSVEQLERFFLSIFHSEGIDSIDVMSSNGSGEIEGAMTSGGFLTFRVAFKFIRGARQISAREVEDFRRQAQVGGSDKGLLITTGAFTQEAMRESARRSSPKIELVGGAQLIDKLKELGLGISVKKVVVEQVVIDPDFFANI